MQVLVTKLLVTNNSLRPANDVRYSVIRSNRDVYDLTCHLGLKLEQFSVRYKREFVFVITVIVIAEFDCICTIKYFAKSKLRVNSRIYDFQIRLRSRIAIGKTFVSLRISVLPEFFF